MEEIEKRHDLIKSYKVIPFLEDFNKKESLINNSNFKEKIEILCWNVRNPSVERARKQVLWLNENDFDIIILTETKKSLGCDFFVNYLKRQGYNLKETIPNNGEYGVIIASKFGFKFSFINEKIDFIQSRALAIELKEKLIGLTIMGLYVPSRGDNSPERVEKKKNFISEITSTLKSIPFKSNFILCGDFNILEPDHIPHYSNFDNWEYKFYTDLLEMNFKDSFRQFHPNEKEYSWVGRTNNGYRYDHFFVSSDLSSLITDCFYIHEPRINKLSDHSGLITQIDLIKFMSRRA